MKEKLIIYQLLPRLFTNTCENPVRFGTLEQNGSGKLNDIDAKVLREIKDLGVNAVWLTGVVEHATKTDFSAYDIEPDNPNIVKGEAGSPYAIKDYYDIATALAVNPRRRMKEFEQCLKRIHSAGLKVIIDFVPNHTARVYHSDNAPKGVEDFGVSDDITMFFRPDNNYYYITNQQFAPSIDLAAPGTEPYVEFPAKATGNDCFNAFCGPYDWYETVKLNYGHDYGDGSDHFDPRPDTWMKMLSVLRFWAAKGVDGFRCDMVFMVPQAFWNWAIPLVRKDYPDVIFIGEIYDVGLYRPFLDFCGFDYLYDKVNLYDTLVNIETKKHSAATLTGVWQTVDGIGGRMLNFLENHDEVRFGSPAYAGDPSHVIPSLVVSSMISTGPMMIYFGQEIGESAKDDEGFAGNNNRTSITDYWSYDTLRRWYNNGNPGDLLLTPREQWLRSKYRAVLSLCNKREAIRYGGFFDLMYVNLRNPKFDPHRLFAFLRHKDDDVLLIIANFGDSEQYCEVNIPDAAFDAANLDEGTFDTIDLLSGRPVTTRLGRGIPASLVVGPKDALVVPLRTCKPKIPQEAAGNTEPSKKK